MLPWKIIGWIALSILIASVIAVSAAGYALYSTGSDAVHALAAPAFSGPGPGGTDAGAVSSFTPATPAAPVSAAAAFQPAPALANDEPVGDGCVSPC